MGRPPCFTHARRFGMATSAIFWVLELRFMIKRDHLNSSPTLMISGPVMEISNPLVRELLAPPVAGDAASWGGEVSVRRVSGPTGLDCCTVVVEADGGPIRDTGLEGVGSSRGVVHENLM